MQKAESSSFKFFGGIVTSSFPNLEMFNWRDEILYDSAINLKEVAYASAYGLGWILVLVFISLFFFKRKEFV